MPLQYQQLAKLSHPKGHSDGIAMVAFSPSGLLLASGGLDGRLCVWDVDSGKLRYVFSGKSAVLSMSWDLLGDEHIVCGMEDGTIASMTMSGDSISVSGFWAHRSPVERLAYNGTYLASGAQEELAVWSRSGKESWKLVSEAGPPPKTSHNTADDVIVTSLHWIETRRRPVVLVATYMHHGIILIDQKTWQRFRSISFAGSIADADLTGDAKLLGVSNMLNGFEVFAFKSLSELEPLYSFNQDVSSGCTIPIRFIHGGNALVGGTSDGKMHVWDLHTLRKQHLPFNGNVEVLAISGHYNQERDAFLIATGVLNRGSPSPVVLWKAQEYVDRRQFSDVLERPAKRSMLSTAMLWLTAILVIYFIS
ncbi:WD40-repeat-containing domain protein [Rhodofomes roseus]|uniref:WD40-repeat-containing domain protein n=1 Tax=Rhodofomes roseus TaxID=34475 RepID=A0ABQ8K9U0_9APHY|nr:WD40-repeat-containing domain protein [Rhodofomes roseus]KAH9834088.1 WD40-repeat-containing domain protein [Rhodofomes roseus]